MVRNKTSQKEEIPDGRDIDSLVHELSNKGINLLTDVGLLGKQERLKRKVYQLSVLVIIASLIITGLVFGAWVMLEKQKQAIGSQMEALEQKLATLQEVSQLAGLYQQRLLKIRQLVSIDDEEKLPGPLQRQLTAMAEQVDGELVAYDYQPDQVGGGFMINNIQELNLLLEKFKEKEATGQWIQVVVNKLSKGAEVYQTDFSFSLKNKQVEQADNGEAISEESD